MTIKNKYIGNIFEPKFYAHSEYRFSFPLKLILYNYEHRISIKKERIILTEFR